MIYRFGDGAAGVPPAATARFGRARPALAAALLAVCVGRAPAAAVPQLLDRIVAVVDNQVILWSELRDRVGMELEARGLSRYVEDAQTDSLRRRVLDQMIDESVVILKAEKDSIQVDAGELEDALNDHYRRIKGSMSQAQYEQMLARSGLTERQLRTRDRRSFRQRLLYRQMRAQLATRQHVTRRDVDDFRAACRDTLPTQLSLSHINLKVTPADSVLQDRLERLKQVQQRLAAGEDFATVAREVSEDPGTAARGGDLGCFERGDLVPEFEQVAFQMKAGQTSEPVLTPSGYHLIQVREKREGAVCASHILLVAKTTSQDRERTERQLAQLRERALAGEDFAQLARQYSQTKATAERGGLWEIFPRDALPDFLAGPLRGLRLGEITQPFFLDDGGHIVKINDDQASLEAVLRETRTAAALDQVIAAYRRQIHVETRIDSAL